jgi:hypothetical protein
MAIEFCILINVVDDEDLGALSASKVDDILINWVKMDGKRTEWFNEKYHLASRHQLIQTLSLL